MPKASNQAWQPPPAALYQLLRAAILPWQELTSPVFVGLDRIPSERPLLFVGNHTLFGVMDVPLLFTKLYDAKGIFLRSLGDHNHFKVPVWKQMVEKFGAVDGTQEVCSQLMAAGESILVFPGGAREVAKRKGEKHQLVWKNRLGFARMAIQHGCTIVPFSSLGPEELFDILVDGDELLATPMGAVARALGMREDFMLPIVAPRRRLERFYFPFAEPIETRQYRGNADDAACWQVRDQTAYAIEQGLDTLVKLRAKDPDRHLRARLERQVPALGRRLLAAARRLRG